MTPVQIKGGGVVSHKQNGDGHLVDGDLVHLVHFLPTACPFLHILLRFTLVTFETRLLPP